MSFANVYLTKQAEVPNLPLAPSSNLGIAIVIPCFNEPDLVSTLNALWQCQRPTTCSVEVIIVLNSGENATPEQLAQNQTTLSQFTAWRAQHQSPELQFFCLQLTNVRHKFAGVGNARKHGMDAAAARFNTLNRPHGAIVGFDADSNCLPNYLLSLETYYHQTQLEGVSLFYEHPLQGTQFPTSTYTRIALYELHLRYFVLAQQWANLPFAHHTVGSSFAVSAQAYVKYGGMNRRKAGEDFYFLQKIIPHGKFGTLYSTAVLPSPRPSDRVPFGTGATIQKMDANNENQYPTYTLQSFEQLRSFNAQRHKLYQHTLQELDPTQFPAPIWQFMLDNDFQTELPKINASSPNTHIFDQRFYQWWSAFRIIKYLNWAHEHHFARQCVVQQTSQLLHRTGHQNIPDKLIDLLQYVRQFEKQGGNLFNY